MTWPNYINSLNDVTGLILAGGRGTRMGNVDKGLQPFRGVPLVSHVLFRLQSQVDEIIINANRNLAAYESLGAVVLPDAMTDFPGPLAGLQTGLMYCKTPFLLSVPCDSPFFPLDLLTHLARALDANEADIAVPMTGDDAAPQIHPVFCLLKIAMLPHLSAYLDNGGRKVDAWFSTLKTTYVHFAEADAFCNINTPEELHRWEDNESEFSSNLRQS